ncbi:Uncharacterised protein [Burkholderia pseudomallei]|nr:hypothetical protein DP47_670 [Burkholderia pseudomallei Pasteur 52237]CAJ3332120.1 Uncharacterised protein [Burkholderia pseudomallei]CAJ6745045.1 Uncharacterised protein [Burkholderia pseudomallei]CAJ8840089.1 Uncharacterised protein [Burkholderia pseudomallei]VBD25466.1 Uncharacterised protein [Burkholderia pseudomallei]
MTLEKNWSAVQQVESHRPLGYGILKNRGKLIRKSIMSVAQLIPRGPQVCVSS